MWGRRRGPRDGERSAERGVRVGGGELAEEGALVDGAWVRRGDPRRSAERGREARGARGSTAPSWRRRGARAG